ncbi:MULTISPECIES: acyltransferase family protein [unclassified Mesorhizobium]|uniref:acyltransferase family protein n=1 Tax=unclassified Mesorhizobium TaxID=325217 RepID=UPI0011284E05|nr:MULTISPECIES: acyltransferase [unclassified Mesorhizobium]MBZ9697014.1 acyltransferase [Mesorhizobium sp. CO1-1-9]TPK09003.1 acyltransferase [Mesorhizobium sp. B2-5-7]
MIWSLQVLRFVAALMVVYVHAAQTAVKATGSNGLLPPELQVVGFAGVDIFFVISGVIIAKTAPGLTWRSFAWRRFRRIVPLYLLISIPYAIVAYKTAFGWREGVATLLLWPATDQMTAPALPAAWTLCFEMLFYAAATIVLVDRRMLLALIGIFGLAMIFRSAGPALQFLGNPLIIEFGFGVALAYAPKWKPAVWCLPIGAGAMIAVGFIGMAPQGGTMEFLAGDNGFQRVLVYGFPAALIVFGTMQIDAQPSAWTVLGDASYMLYLIHTLPITLLLMVWTAFPIPPDLIIVIGTAISVLFAWRMYIRFELPLRKFLRRYDPHLKTDGHADHLVVPDAAGRG